jgi:hypothetical protein
VIASVVKRGSIHIKFSMTRKEKGDYLIELTAWAGLTVSLMLQIKTLNIIGVILLTIYGVANHLSFAINSVFSVKATFNIQVQMIWIGLYGV